MAQIDEYFDYSGGDVLEVLEGADNYNSSLLDYVKKAMKIAGVSKDGLIVDFGAGIGTYAKMLRTRDSIDPICVELDDKQRMIIEKEGFISHKSLAEITPGTVDVVYALNVLEHIEDHEDIVKEISAVLKPGGVFIAYVPAFGVLYSKFDKKVGHRRRYRRKPLDTIMKQSGLDIEHSRYADPIGFFAALAYKLLMDKKASISPASVKIYDRYIFPSSKVLQALTGKLFGKNVVVIAKKPVKK
jgi:2-polyprenyl-3-methyl-5-hydroxy-6-metoxy-1,4-benzoquinol methylase